MKQPLLLIAASAFISVALADIGRDSGATYRYDAARAATKVHVFARTTDADGKETTPTQSDCDLAENLLKDACGDDLVRHYQCELHADGCPSCDWAACTESTFYAPALCARTLSADSDSDDRSNGSTVTATAGIAEIKTNVQALYGKPSCRLDDDRRALRG